MEELITYLARAIVDYPDDVSVNRVEQDDLDLYELGVNKSDLGKVIGRRGRTARAFRAVVRAAGAKLGRPSHLEILE